MTDHPAPQRGKDKFKRLPIVAQPAGAPLKKPAWLRVRAMRDTDASRQVRAVLARHQLSTVCHEANCPNIARCFEKATATFLIMGNVCTRRCRFCDIAHARPEPLDPTEPARLARAAREMGLKYVVVTSVDRDDLADGGAAHFAQVIRELRNSIAGVRVEILTPDFRGRMDRALDAFGEDWPDVFNHNIETVPSLYKLARPAADYRHSLELLARFKERHPDVPTKSGLMLGLGETDQEVREVLSDLRAHRVDIVTIGQYLAPTPAHLPVARYVSPQAFEQWKTLALDMGFQHASSGVFVRSSYQAGDVFG